MTDITYFILKAIIVASGKVWQSKNLAELANHLFLIDQFISQSFFATVNLHPPLPTNIISTKISHYMVAEEFLVSI